MSEERRPSYYRCEYPSCTRSVADGDTIYRTSPKGDLFRGRCLEHYPPEEMDPELEKITQIIESDGKTRQ